MGREASKPQRSLRRCHETSRLEEQLWILVFEELWPVAARSPGPASMSEGDRQEAAGFERQLARSA